MNKKKVWIIVGAAVLAVALAVVLILVLGNREESGSSLNAGDPNCSHQWGDWEESVAASCQDGGRSIRQCQKCGREEEQTVDPFGHVFYRGECQICRQEEKDCDHEDTYRVTVSQPTCTEYGEKRDVCIRCFAVVKSRPIEPTGHGETTSKEIQERTCTQDGIVHLICEDCGEVADILYSYCEGHDYYWVDDKDATCQEDGYYSYEACHNCSYTSGIEVIGAYGHEYFMGVCDRCQAEDSSFVMMEAPEISDTYYPMTQSEKLGMQVQSARVDRFSGAITASGQTDSYYLAAETAGTHCVWLAEVSSNVRFELYLYDQTGTLMGKDTYFVNGDIITLALDPGAYTLQLRYDYGYSSYDLYVAHQKPTTDVTGADVIRDSMEFYYQNNVYSFTAPRNGVYCFGINGMANDSTVVMYLYDHLGSEIGRTYCSNGEGTAVRLDAGETISIEIYNRYNCFTPYSLNVFYQTPTIRMDGYTSVSDQIAFQNQENYYTFTATSTAYSLTLEDLDNTSVSVYLYDSLGNTVAYDSYCSNGQGLECTDLVVGEVYTVRVSYRSKVTPYTLHLIPMGEPIAVTGNTAVKDALQYYYQKKCYHFTATVDGTMTLYIDLYDESEGYYVYLYVYDKDGNLEDSYYMYDESYLYFYDLTAGEEYTFVVCNTTESIAYTIAFL